jgi:hypothetical protein
MKSINNLILWLIIQCDRVKVSSSNVNNTNTNKSSNKLLADFCRELKWLTRKTDSDKNVTTDRTDMACYGRQKN